MEVELTKLKGQKAELFGGYLDVKDAAKILKVTPRRVRQIIQDGDLAAVKVGNAYVISRESLGNYMDDRPTVGRPKGT